MNPDQIANVFTCLLHDVEVLLRRPMGSDTRPILERIEAGKYELFVILEQNARLEDAKESIKPMMQSAKTEKLPLPKFAKEK